MKEIYVEICGVRFEDVTTTKKGEEVQERNSRTPETLWQAYNRVSGTKERIYEEWRKFCNSLDGYGFGVNSHNCNIFTLQFETECAWYFITPSHNYICYK